jgi:Secretion system C-terminal sorting domain
MILKTWVAMSLVVVCFGAAVAQENCTSPLQWQPVQRNNAIEWSKFPEFSLPFMMIYEGPRFGDGQSMPLKRGFSHLARFSGNEAATLPAAQRATGWYHVATDPTPQQPWADKTLKSPWNNNLTLYRQTWDKQLSDLANQFDDSRGRGVPNFNIIATDIERIWDNDRDILPLKNNAQIAPNYRNLTDEAFVTRYKRDIQKLYAAPIDYLKTKALATTTKLTSYSDAPIRGNFNNWLALKATTWKDWTTDPNTTLHLMRDSLSNKIGGAFYKHTDILTPSCYYYYTYETQGLGKDYLAYLLFVIEANRYWSDKPIVPYVWLRYHDYFNPTTPFVPKFVAEATAIFPFFSGANGLWLWDGNVEPQSHNYAIYEYFVASLYRLSFFKNFFEGNYELVIPQPALENARTSSPIWRGSVKNNEILIAAQNPYANTDTDVKEITVNYKNWTQNITLRGREVFLCKFDLRAVSSINKPVLLYNLTLYPNPVYAEALSYRFEGVQAAMATIELRDLLGRLCVSETVSTQKGTNQGRIAVNGLRGGLYMVKININNYETTQKIIINR